MEMVKKYTIGISCFYHDSSACLFLNGKLIFACEEEKFSGIKHDHSYPTKTLKYIFNNYNITYDDIGAVCFYEDPKIKGERVKENYREKLFKFPFYSIRTLREFKKNQKILNKELSKFKCEKFYSKHHDSHLYYSAYSSPYKKGLVVSIDGVGEKDTSSISSFNGKELQPMTIGEYPHSLGLFYSAMTAFLGFKPNEGEYKVMGLTAYGSYKKYIEPLRDMIYFKEGKIISNMKYFSWDSSDKIMFKRELSELLGLLPRIPDSKLTQEHKDLASAVQKRYEEVFFELLNFYHSLDPTNENLCLGGGCAYNGLANGKIYENTPFKHLWIPPSPSDAGSAIGACINYFITNGVTPYIPNTPFLGPSFMVTKSYKDLIPVGFISIFLDDESINRLIARELYRGKVIGWFKNEIEFGARALGNRSILADPTKPKMKDRINKLVKKREGFRPFAPMVTKERQNDFFEVKDDIPYMNQVVKVREDFRNILPSVTHIDGTARVQTVYQDNPIHNLLREFEKLTSYPILLNTSFNVKDKTMVLTPKDAIDTFFDTDIDILVLQNIVVFNNRDKK